MKRAELIVQNAGAAAFLCEVFQNWYSDATRTQRESKQMHYNKEALISKAFFLVASQDMMS